MASRRELLLLWSCSASTDSRAVREGAWRRHVRSRPAGRPAGFFGLDVDARTGVCCGDTAAGWSSPCAEQAGRWEPSDDKRSRALGGEQGEVAPAAGTLRRRARLQALGGEAGS